MEKDNYKNDMDDFVRKSFDQYEEDPSFDMWDRIEPLLPELEQKRRPFFWWSQYRWQVGAAAAILILAGTMLWMQQHYESKIQALTPPAGNQPLSQPAIPVVPSTTTNPNSITTAVQPQSDAQQGLNPTPKTSPEVTTTQPKQRFAAPTQQTNDPRATKEGMPAKSIGQSTQIPVPLSGMQLDSAVQHPLAPIAVGVIPKQPIQPVADPKAPAFVFVPMQDLAVIAHKKPELVRSPDHLELSDEPITRRFTPPTGWYVGFSLTPHLLAQQNRGSSRPMRPGFRPEFAAKQDHLSFSTDVGLRIGKQINQRFALESGIGYQQFTRKTKHTPQFAYRDGFLINIFLRARRFDYRLNTYGGSASVTLRTEESGPISPIDDEPIKASIVSTEHIQILQVPVIGVVRLGMGRLQGVLKAGITANWFLKNEIDITKVDLNNNRLRLLADREISWVYDEPNQLYMGYLASAGIEYRFRSKWSLTALPTLAGNFRKTNASGEKQPGNISTGINIGLNRWF